MMKLDGKYANCNGIAVYIAWIAQSAGHVYGVLHTVQYEYLCSKKNKFKIKGIYINNKQNDYTKI